MSLGKYKSKRNFRLTKEPRGKNFRVKNASANFVIQKHEASHLHYDFRLESEGVLKSWAIPKGMPKTGEKKLAMMVEDHPIEYQNFEGVIPEGNYGAGKVIIWDKGKYFLKEKNLAVSGGIRKGSFAFTLNGRKLKGEFTMVRLRKAGENSWLLIGKNVKNVDKKIEDVSMKSGRTIEEMGDISFDLAKMPGVRKAKMPEFVSPMLAQLETKSFDRKNWLFEIKWDGYRVMARKSGKKVMLLSRSRKNFTEAFFPIARTLEKMQGDFILDGEVVAVGKNGRSSFQLLQNYLAERQGTIIYYVFDIIHLNGYDLKKLPLLERKSILQNLLPRSGNVKSSEYIEEKGIELFDAMTKSGMEGIMAKKSDSQYHNGRRSGNWLKIKTNLEQEAIIGGFTKPKGGRKKFGALVLGVWKNGKLEYIGHVGGGFDDKTLDFVYAKLKKIITEKSPFKKNPQTNSPVSWVKPEVVCQVKFSEWTSDGIMRQPIFLGLREDKNADEVGEEFSKDKNMKKNMMNRIYKSGEEETNIKVDGQKIKLTNLKKIYWPKEGYTKGDMINYYIKISQFILPHLRDRPESLRRFPNGIEGEDFFQKDMADAPDWIPIEKIYSESEGRTVRYMLCQNQAALVYMANLGSIEINPWNSRIGNLEKPDYMIFDIDPVEIPFIDAVKVANEIKKILDKIKIKSYPKTSGMRGIHIFVPLGAKYGYEEVKEFARLVGMMANRRLPEITSLERKPGERQGKVYLDYLQNREGQTMAAPYSLRPRDGAPVSTPLEWKEMNERLSPDYFNIKNIFERLEKKGDVWKNFFREKNSLEESLTLLQKLLLTEFNQSGSVLNNDLSSNKNNMARYGRKAQKMVKDAMHKMKRGKLKSGRTRAAVKSRKQAVAIGLSEARRKGAKVPLLSKRKRSSRGSSRKRSRRIK